ncbi:hypothetical protein LTR17_019735 [Elasticomyces elasticus]|nr:hypothetical protein LTR17_019735 [Elasticomyces elasticus]
MAFIIGWFDGAMDQYQDYTVKMEKEGRRLTRSSGVRAILENIESAKEALAALEDSIDGENTRLRQRDKDVDVSMRKYYTIKQRNITSYKAVEELNGDLGEVITLLKKVKATRS